MSEEMHSRFSLGVSITATIGFFILAVLYAVWDHNLEAALLNLILAKLFNNDCVANPPAERTPDKE